MSHRFSVLLKPGGRREFIFDESVEVRSSSSYILNSLLDSEHLMNRVKILHGHGPPKSLRNSFISFIWILVKLRLRVENIFNSLRIIVCFWNLVFLQEFSIVFVLRFISGMLHDRIHET